MTRTQDQIRGCLLGAAAADALGYCVQELNTDEIHEQFGPQGIRGYFTENGYALVSSNTQLLLYTANGLLYGQTRGALRGVMGPYTAYLRRAYNDWMKTQVYGGRRLPGKYICWLNGVRELFSRRNPDRTTQFAFATERQGTTAEPINRDKGAACLARVLPVGLFLRQEEKRQEAASLGAEAAALTHGDPLAFLSGAFLTQLLTRILGRRSGSFRALVHEALAALEEQFGREYPQVRQIAALLTQAETLADQPAEPEAVMVQLDPKDAHRVLAAACYACLKFPGDFERAVAAAVNHSGDSAATGALTGALMGALVGTEGIPEFYLEPLELRETLEEMADDLFTGCPMYQGNRLFDDQWNDKYVVVSSQ